MNILITGATSFLGYETVLEALAEGYEVYALVREGSRKRLSSINSEHLHIIICDMQDIENAKLPNIDMCMHFAWGGPGILLRADKNIQEENVSLTLRLIKKLSSCGCKRFIMAGSQAELGITLEKKESRVYNGLPVDESYDEDPLSEYGKAKLRVLKEAGSLCKSLDITYIHARIFSIYGSGDHSTSLVETAIKCFKENKPLVVGSCRQLWNYMNIKDLSKAMCDLLVATFTESDSYKDNVVHVASTDTRPLRDFVEEIKKITNSSSDIIYEEREPSSEGTAYMNPNIAKLKRLTGFKPSIDFEVGIRSMIGDKLK